MTLLKLAWRNLGRHRRRTLITASAIALGLALMVFFSGFADGMHGQMIRTGVRQMAGHVVVYGEGYSESQDSAVVVPDTQRVLESVRQAAPEARIVQRVFIEGLLTAPGGSAGVALTAVDPQAERPLTDLDDKIVAGSYLDGGASQLVIGATLARSLEVEPGDDVTLMSQGGGEIRLQTLTVQGIYKTGMDDLDSGFGHILLKDGQELLGLGADVTQISLHLADPDDTAPVTARVRAALGGQPVEVLPWQEALPELHQFVLLDDAGMYLLLMIIAVIVMMGILNTVLMSVLERTRELGVLLAIGLAPGRVAGLVLVEATLLGLVGVACGVAIGLALNYPMETWGVDLAQFTGQSFETAGVSIDAFVRSDLSMAKVGVFAAITLGLTLLSSVYPAWRASQLEPAQSMHHQM